MSELQRSFAKAKLAGLPSEALLPLDTFREEDECPEGQADEFCPWSQSAQDEDSSSASSTGTIKPNRKHLFAKPTGFVISPFHLLCYSFHLFAFFEDGPYRYAHDP